MVADVLFLARNRLEYTTLALENLKRNTDWSLVGTLYLYDDQSEDGTREYLAQAVEDMPVEAVFKAGAWNQPISVLLDAARLSAAPLIAKIDNDMMVPARWLNISMGVMEEHEKLQLLGLAWRGDTVATEGDFSFVEAIAIGGVGLFRRQTIVDWYNDPIEAAKAAPPSERYLRGIDQRAMLSGWLVPNLPICHLDHVPFEPWLSHGKRYVEKGWQRPCSTYDPEMTALWDWWAW